ncbi:hypothetical protein AB1Y20_000835 [Prymnesium parvum]|uniref:H(+)-exporting diphosphatase n=1 Tax=Prymnesium parvum TaxID=97485 RepID=A0AB34K9Q0_PRYPA
MPLPTLTNTNHFASLRALGTRDHIIWALLATAAVGAVLGALVAIFTNDALYEISTVPAFATAYGVILIVLGSLMVWRKLWDRHEAMAKRALVLGFSVLVMCSGAACFLLEKDWFMHVPYLLKVPLYMLLGVSLSFTVSCSLVDIASGCIDRVSDEYSRVFAWSPHQVFLILAGAVVMGAAVGFMFGVVDVEDDFSRIQGESATLVGICSVFGGITGAANVLLEHHSNRSRMDERSQLNSAT